MIIKEQIQLMINLLFLGFGGLILWLLISAIFQDNTVTIDFNSIEEIWIEFILLCIILILGIIYLIYTIKTGDYIGKNPI